QAPCSLTSARVHRGRVEFCRLPTNRVGTRDFGPIFVRRMPPQREVAIARFRFNAWAKYPDWKQDDRIPERVAAKLKLPLYRARGEGGKPDIVHAGGAIDVNGRGTLLTNEQRS